MGLYIVLQHSHPSIYSTCYFSSKTFNKIIFLPKLSTFSDREFRISFNFVRIRITSLPLDA